MGQDQITLEQLNNEVNKLRKDFEQMKEDLEFARRTEEAWQRIESGEYISIDSKDLAEEMKKW